MGSRRKTDLIKLISSTHWSSRHPFCFSYCLIRSLFFPHCTLALPVRIVFSSRDKDKVCVMTESHSYRYFLCCTYIQYLFLCMCPYKALPSTDRFHLLTPFSSLLLRVHLPGRYTFSWNLRWLSRNISKDRRVAYPVRVGSAKTLNSI